MAAAVEYGLITGLMGVVIITAVTTAGENISSKVSSVAESAKAEWCAPLGVHDNSCFNNLIVRGDGSIVRVSLGNDDFDRSPDLAARYLTAGARLVKPTDADFPAIAARYVQQKGHP